MKIAGYEILIECLACVPGTSRVILFADNLKELRAGMKEEGLDDYDIWWNAAEIVNENGETNPPVWSETRQGAINKLKKLLK